MALNVVPYQYADGGVVNQLGNAVGLSADDFEQYIDAGVLGQLCDAGDVSIEDLSQYYSIGGVIGQFIDFADGLDNTPDPFSFTSVTGAALDTDYVSNEITVSGLDTLAELTVSGGQYSINGGAFASAMTTVGNGDMVKVKKHSSASLGTSVSMTLTIGGVSSTYTVTTTPVDTTPNAFTFMDVTGALLNTIYTAGPITVSGINSAATVSVTGGSYRKNGGSWTSSPGTVVNGDTVEVRGTSSTSTFTAIDVTLTIGGVSDTFRVTTGAGPEDTTPNAFTFTDVTGAAISTAYESNTITVAGITAPASMTITGGQYSKNGGPYSSTTTTVVNGDTVKVKVTSSGSFSTAVSTTLTIGGVSDTYSVTTVASDTTPSAFSFTDVTGAALNTDYESNTITVAGLNTSTTVSITGGQYSKNGGSYASGATTAVNGDTFKVKGTSSGSFSTAVNVTLTIGGVSDTYTVTTLPADTTPSAFSFTDVTDATAATVYESNEITVAGLNTSSPVSITGGQYSKNGGSYASGATTAVNGDTFKLKVTSSALNSTTVSATLTIGGVSDTYSVTTEGDTTLDVPGLSWESAQSVNPPYLVVSLPGSTVAGDHIVIEVSSDGGTIWTEYLDATVTDPDAGELDDTADELANGNYKLRARMERGSDVSDWSTVVNITIAV